MFLPGFKADDSVIETLLCYQRLKLFFFQRNQWTWSVFLPESVWEPTMDDSQAVPLRFPAKWQLPAPDTRLSVTWCRGTDRWWETRREVRPGRRVLTSSCRGELSWQLSARYHLDSIVCWLLAYGERTGCCGDQSHNAPENQNRRWIIATIAKGY